MNERMINCPMQAVPKLHEALVEDIAWAIENEVMFSFLCRSNDAGIYGRVIK